MLKLSNPLETGITKLNKVGQTTAKRLTNLGINTINDLLFYFPHKYEDLREITKIKDLASGQTANVVGQIELLNNKRSPRRHMNITEALVSDDTEQIKIIWFNQPFIAKNLQVGDKVSIAGKVKDEYGSFTMISPVYEKITTGQLLHTGKIVPAYHLTANITQKQIRFLLKEAQKYLPCLDDWMPTEILKKYNLISLKTAISKIHFPENFEDISLAKKRLAFDEHFLLQLQAQMIKLDYACLKSNRIFFKENETKKFVKNLPFQLTDAQKKASWEILQDMTKDRPMARLLEGDVGCGKTIVAVMALLNAALNEKQAAIMVPTEILANQHFKSITKILKDWDLNIALFTRTSKLAHWGRKKTKAIEKKISKKIILEHIKSGDIDIIIGTHAIIQADIEFHDLCLAIIDEQHRFGVEQRKTIVDKSGGKNNTPHLLSMTATPIPRSLAMSLFGDLDISIINEMPKGRKAIITRVVSEMQRPLAYDFIRKEIKSGRQAFVICPLIDLSDKLGVKSVKDEYEKLSQQIFPDLKIGILHGRMKTPEKDAVMNSFINNEINILVSTSVVEVGVDIPNATIMMIEGADRFGLAQLHQFRGRVGRGIFDSYCFLFAE
jgi:ATP-dependent DNA helicase RecG